MTPPASRDRQARAGALACALAAACLLVLVTGRPAPVSGAGAPAPDMRLDPARDPVPALDALPRVGPRTARALAAAASEAPFHEGRDLRRVRGIGPVTAARIAPHLRLPSPPLPPLPPPLPADSHAGTGPATGPGTSPRRSAPDAPR